MDSINQITWFFRKYLASVIQSINRNNSQIDSKREKTVCFHNDFFSLSSLAYESWNLTYGITYPTNFYTEKLWMEMQANNFTLKQMQQWIEISYTFSVCTNWTNQKVLRKCNWLKRRRRRGKKITQINYSTLYEVNRAKVCVCVCTEKKWNWRLTTRVDDFLSINLIYPVIWCFNDSSNFWFDKCSAKHSISALSQTLWWRCFVRLAKQKIQK